jgi:Flp pilus assembly protein protease CpaA
VKLMAGFGALLGAGRLLEAALWTAGVGGVLALGAIGFKSVRRAIRGGEGPASPEEKESIPYAPAITLGVWLSLVPKS